MKQYFENLIFVFVLFFLLMVQPIPQTFADYVLPYPSYMPGNRLYGLSLALDQLKAYWYWGNIASTKYHLQLADKYLVEAKILFEYNQYLLATRALTRSDKEFLLIPKSLQKAVQEGKGVSPLKKVIEWSAAKHVEVLTKLSSELPHEFVWRPEKEKPTTLSLEKYLKRSLEIRSRVQDDVLHL